MREVAARTDDPDRDRTGRGPILDDIYVFLVRGPSSKLPRGYIWLIPVWFGALGLLVLLAGRKISGRMPVWLAATELGCMVLAGLTLVCVLGTVRRHAFRVSSDGIWLGCRTTRKRPRPKKNGITSEPASRSSWRPRPGLRTIRAAELSPISTSVP